MRCPSCGARNPDSAAWCTQCYTTFADGEAALPQTDDDAPAVDPVAAGDEAAHGADADGDVATEGGDRRFRDADDGLEWRCAVCSSWNPLETSGCATCGAPFGRTLAEEPDDVIARGTSTVLVLSAVLPGAGHVALGRTVDGVVRAVMYVLWLAGALALLRAAAGTPAPALPAAPLGIGALALWLLSVLDAVALAEGSRDQLLTPRVFLWLVVGVIGALIAAFVPGMLRITDLGGG